MIRAALLALLPATLVVAAPMPPESEADKVARLDAEKVAKLWGKLESPPGKYIAKPDDNRLTLRTLGWPLGLRHGTPAFRVSREVVGDFDVRLTVQQLSPPDNTVRYEGIWAETGAGLFIEGGENNLSLYRWKSFMRSEQVPDTNMRSGFWIEYTVGRQGGASGQGTSNIAPDAAVELRVVREKEAISAYVRVAGQNWQQQTVRGDLQLPPAVTVSVFLGHSTTQECQATFADFSIGKPEKAK